MKKCSRNLLALVSTVFLAGSSIVPILAFAESVDNTTVYSQNINDEEQQLLNRFSEQSEVLAFQEYTQSIGININSTEMIITDYQMEQLFSYMDIDLSQYRDSTTPMTVAAGVTKVVKRNGNGNYDVYLSRSFLRNYYGGATIIGSGLTVAIGALSGGVLLPVSAAMVTALANHSKGEINDGYVVRVRRWGLSSISKQ